MNIQSEKPTSTSSWGSVFGAIAGACASIASFLPMPYQLYVGIAGGIAGVLATKLP